MFLGNLSPVSPVKISLSPVNLGTKLLNGINDLQSFFGFVPGVPGKKCQEGEAVAQISKKKMHCTFDGWQYLQPLPGCKVPR